jgi:hypothetical protein
VRTDAQATLLSCEYMNESYSEEEEGVECPPLVAEVLENMHQVTDSKHARKKTP